MSNLRPVLLIANNFPPVRGGSAAVYANLARCAQGRIAVLAPRVAYADGLPVIGWREHDRHAPYTVIRLALLRTVFGRAHRGLFSRLHAQLRDAALRARITWAMLKIVLGRGVRTICIGELLASSWIIALASRIPGLRVVAYVHGEEITTADSYDPDHRRSRRALQGADVIVVVSAFTRRTVEALMGPAAADKIRLIENGVDTDRFKPGARSESLVDYHGLRGRFVFVSVCRLLEKKGIDVTIQAFARVQRLHPQACYLVVGTGPHGPFLRSLAASEGVADHVIFAGAVAEDELVEHYQLGDVFVMPNRRLPDGDTEGFGLVFLEANACGLPVIAGRDGGSTDAVQDGVNGLVVDGAEIGAVEAAMLRLLQDKTLREALTAGGRRIVAASSWSTKAEMFLAVCETG